MTERGAPIDHVAVVVPAHNAASYIGAQLRAIRSQDEPWLREVVVVDNRSTDRTRDVVDELARDWSKLRSISESQPGANAARNAGVSATSAGSTAVLLCDADDVVAEGWLRALRAALTRNDVVRGRYELRCLNNPDTIAARGSLASTGPPPPNRPINGLGGNCGFRRSAWELLGGLAEDHYGSDDEEFFWRAQLAGLSVGYAGDAVVHYRLRPSFADLYRQQRSWASNRAQLYRDFGHHGFIERRSLARAARSWAWSVAHAADAFSSSASRRGKWVRVLAGNVGRMRGSVRHRTVYP